MDPSALGRYLRESREAKEVTLEDAVSALRIRRPILEAFEQGDFTLVETPVQMRGLLRNYARFLDLEEERVLQYYEAAMNPKRRRGRFGRRKKRDTELIAPRRITDTPPTLPAVPDTITQPRRERTSRRVSTNTLRNVLLFLVACVALGFIAYVIIDTTQIWPARDDEPAEMAANTNVQPQPLGTTTVTATFIPTSTPIEPTSATLDFASQGFAGLSVRMEMTQRAWVRIVADDVEQLAEVLEPGEIIEFDANDTVEIVTANAIAVRLTVNGITQPTFGRRGQQAEVNISTSGISITLEGEPTPTPTATDLPATNTPQPSPTLNLPTSTPTAIEVNSIGQTPEPTNDVTSEPTLAPPTPTSIFNESAPLVTDESTMTPVADNTITNAQAAVAADTSTQSDNTVEQPSATPLPPTATGAVLPLRSTPANPTPTKSG